MSYINVTTKMFFDRAGIIAAMTDKSRKCLSSALAFGRQVMKRGMRRRKGVSAVGDYPSAHKNSLLRDFIFFGLDVKTLSGVVGPTLLHRGGSGMDREIVSGAKTVPELINEGGIVIRHRAMGRGRTFRRVGTAQKQIYKPRPFVALTLPKTAAKLADNMAKFPLRKGA